MQRLQRKNNLLYMLCNFSRSLRHSKSLTWNRVTKVSIPANWIFNSRMQILKFLAFQKDTSSGKNFQYIFDCSQINRLYWRIKGTSKTYNQYWGRPTGLGSSLPHVHKWLSVTNTQICFDANKISTCLKAPISHPARYCSYVPQEINTQMLNLTFNNTNNISHSCNKLA